MPLLCGSPARDLLGPGHVAAVQRLSQARPARPAREVLSAACPRVRTMLSGTARAVRAAAAHLRQRLRLLLLVLRPVAAPRAGLRRADDAALRLRQEASRGGDRFQRRLSAAVFREARRAS